ncbi:MAG: hypothetical protein J1G05_06100 [Clostridiales bacterium]|nr:hypothetical protein [Clostridiales bacterium]
MYKTLKRVALLFLLTFAVLCGSVFLAACDEPTGGDDTEGDGKVTYTVTVTSEVSDIALTTVKAQWLLSNNEPASDEIALDENGKASVELDATSYTVMLIGVPVSKATYIAANVTALSPNATITLKAVSVSPTQLAAPNDVAISAGVLTWSAVSNADGYVVYKGNEVVAEVGSTTLKYTIPTDLVAGTYLYTVVAKGDGVHYANSEKSAPATHTVEDSND